MINNIELVEHIKSKIASLIEINTKLKERLKGISYENSKLSKENLELKQKIKALNEKIEALTLANGLSGDIEAQKEAQAKVKKILREINNCITLINNN